MTAVARLHKEFSEIIAFFDQEKQLSFRSSVDEYFRKNLLLSAASYFEHRVTSEVQLYAAEIAGANTLIPELVRNKAIARQYHTWFDWDKANANSFFGLFGAKFRGFMAETLKCDPDLVVSIRDFLEIGRERNRLVHQDFGTFTLEKTGEEIYNLYSSAFKFVDRLATLLRECPSES